ncbi:MAG: dihydrodipicolinate synthase family protein [Candidatus Latescibacterota bacterium]|nr:MAG: dihydrodipicolinate synthase family protein [Candidatus Latescibacterota bacterium]
MQHDDRTTENPRDKIPRGIFAAALTPQKDDLTIDHDALLGHCQWLLANGCDGVCLFGTTGEAASFTVDERKTALESIVNGGFPPDRLLVGTGCCAIPDTVALTKRAVGWGAGGVLVIPPYFYKDVSDNAIVEAHRKVIDGTGTSGVNFYLYHYPYMSGVSLSPTVIKTLADEYPGVVVGIKDSSGDSANMKTICESFPHLEFFPGTETLLLDSLRLGGAGCISATINVTASLAAEIVARREDGDARDLQNRLTAIRTTFDRYPLIEALKHMMAVHTGREAWRNARPPISRLTRAEGERLESDLASLGFALG